MTMTITRFEWVPNFARGFVRDLRPRWACEEIGLEYKERLIEKSGEEIQSAHMMSVQSWFMALSSTSNLVYEGVRLGAELDRQSLLSALSVIGEDGLRADNVSNKQLGQWYGRMVAHADRVIENAAFGN